MTPDEFTNQEFFLDVGNGHRLYVHDWGNPKAKTPIVYLHGGPGSGCSDSHKQSYDPSSQRVIFHDQRGSGKNSPAGGTSHNETNELVEDINKIADKLSIDKFVLHGRSWGSCLAFCYAIKHPDRVASILTGGIFLGTKAELDFDERGDRYSTFFPDVWQALLNQTPVKFHHAPITYHMKRVLSDDSQAAKQSAYVYSRLILSVLRLDDRARPMDFDSFDLSGVKIEAHYKLNRCFLDDDYIMKNTSMLNMPIHIIQGRYDVMCVPEVAYELQQNLPNSTLQWVIAGHTGSDRAIYDATQAALLRIG